MNLQIYSSKVSRQQWILRFYTEEEDKEEKICKLKREKKENIIKIKFNNVFSLLEENESYTTCHVG